MEGRLQFQMDFEFERGPLKVPYNKIPQIGASIGVNENDLSAGTLGGYVELHDATGYKRVCGLTCHHVVCPPQGLEPGPTAPDFCEPCLHILSIVHLILTELDKFHFKKAQIS